MTFRITCLSLPKQHATMDSCEPVASHMDSFLASGLLSLGWIHVRNLPPLDFSPTSFQTHPKFHCFLSSVDLHAQFGEQWCLPEAVAIVCAGRGPNCIGIFSLTEHGMSDVQGCRLTGFHDTHGKGVYTAASHVCLDSSAAFAVEDRRSLP